MIEFRCRKEVCKHQLKQNAQNAVGVYLQVYSCAVLKDPGSGLNRGYGFIKYKSKEIANAAMDKLNNTEMKDHPGHQVCCCSFSIYTSTHAAVSVHLLLCARGSQRVLL